MHGVLVLPRGRGLEAGSKLFLTAQRQFLLSSNRAEYRKSNPRGYCFFLSKIFDRANHHRLFVSFQRDADIRLA
jgi:hypothetical protein